MDSADFFVMLPSNASLDHYPENTLSSFKTRLPTPVHLENEWEVALTEIQFPHSISALSEGRILVGTYAETQQQKKDGSLLLDTFPYNALDVQIVHHTTPTLPLRGEGGVSKQRIDNQMRTFTGILPPHQHYTTPESFVTSLNNLLQDPKEFSGVLKTRHAPQSPQPYPISIQYSTAKGVEITIRDRDIIVTLSPSIARVLGFPVHSKQWVSFKNRGTWVLGNTRVDLEADRPNLFHVYCNLSEPVVVGDIMASSLRCVHIPIKGNTNSLNHIVSHSYANPHYVRLALKSFDTVEIYLRDLTGLPIYFLGGGIVSLTLHFRRRRHLRE